MLSSLHRGVDESRWWCAKTPAEVLRTLALRVRWRKGVDGHRAELAVVAAMNELLLLLLLQEQSGRRREAAPLRRIVMAVS